jgi:1-acyl-sn-glycerol-3-phosphate acyltransferase
MVRRPFRRFVAKIVLSMTGWKAVGARPEPQKYVLIAAPHTTNWDFFYLLVFAAFFELNISWMGKHSIFRGPLNPIMRASGGVPVRRHKSEKLVMTMARIFDDHEELGLVVPAEGTRAYVEYWKSGFYHIAMTANVPIVMSFLDYSKKAGGFGPAFYPSGHISQDMDSIRAFYQGRMGKYPEKFGTIRLREEDTSQD